MLLRKYSNEIPRGQTWCSAQMKRQLQLRLAPEGGIEHRRFAGLNFIPGAKLLLYHVVVDNSRSSGIAHPRKAVTPLSYKHQCENKPKSV